MEAQVFSGKLGLCKKFWIESKSVCLWFPYIYTSWSFRNTNRIWLSLFLRDLKYLKLSTISYQFPFSSSNSLFPIPRAKSIHFLLFCMGYDLKFFHSQNKIKLLQKKPKISVAISFNITIKTKYFKGHLVIHSFKKIFTEYPLEHCAWY